MPGSGAPCFLASMMKRIMTPRMAALAFAAMPFLAAPALADAPASSLPTGAGGLSVNLGDASLYVTVDHNDSRRRDGRHYRENRWGQRRWEVRRMKRDARHRCAAAIERAGYRAGFRDVDIDDDIRVRQVGPRGFEVRFDEVEFEGRRREFERDVHCSVRRGNVVNLSGLPQRGRRGHGYHHRYDRDDHYGRRHHDGRLRGGRYDD